MRRGADTARVVAGALLLLLAACRAPAPTRPGGIDPLAERRARLADVADWAFDGRAALSNGKDAVTVRIEWRQRGPAREITLRAPVSGETWRLRVDGGGAVLEGGGREPRRGPDAERLLREEAGLQVPVAALADWVRGLSHLPGRAEVEQDADGRPVLIRESGWQIRLRDYDGGVVPALPRALDAERAPYRVRLAISSWQPGPS